MLYSTAGSPGKNSANRIYREKVLTEETVLTILNYN